MRALYWRNEEKNCEIPVIKHDFLPFDFEKPFKIFSKFRQCLYFELRYRKKSRDNVGRLIEYHCSQIVDSAQCTLRYMAIQILIGKKRTGLQED